MGDCHEVLKKRNCLSMAFFNPYTFLFIILSFNCAYTSDVPSPPYFTSQPKNEILFKVRSTSNEPFVLQCQAGGRPTPKYTWYKNGVVFQSDVYDKRISQQPDRGTLVFVKPARNDEGLYQCRATNVHGTAISNAAFVRQAELNSFPVTSDKFFSLNEGEPYTLKCKPPSGYPKPSIHWIMLPRSGGGTPMAINSSRITVDPQGNLHFSNITLQDDNEEEYYACSANSMILSEFKFGNKVTLTVNPSGNSAQNSVEPIKQFASPPNIVALMGKVLRLYCIYGGTPLPNVIWRKKNGKLPAGRHTYESFGKILKIKRVQFEDKGNYECEVSNQNGPTRSHVISVVVQAAPYWFKYPNSVTRAEEENVSFQCEARGEPKPKLNWFANGVPIKRAAYNSRRTIQESTLTIVNLQKSDTAVYQCNASNTHGYVYSNFYVNVMSLPPQIINRPKQMTQAVIGSKVKIDCKAEGAPIPKVTWKFDGTQLTGGRHVFTEEGLIIDEVQMADQGKYECLAVNKLDRDSASGNLVVKEKTVLTVKPVDYEVAAGNQATFRCSAKSDPSLVLEIIWLRNKQEIDFESDQRFVLTDDGSLRISSTVELDSGTYTCIAKTPLDSQQASAGLTVQDVPNRPIMLGIECGEKSATIEWKSNGDNRASITGYVIQYNTSYTPDVWVDVFSSYPTSEMKFKVVLNLYTNYTFRVIAKNKIGSSLPSLHSSRCATLPDRPMNNPQNVVGKGTNKNNLVISWTPMQKIEYNAPGFKYKVFWKRRDMSNTKFSTSIVEPDQSHIVINGQPTFKPYTIKVLAFNVKGNSLVDADDVIGYSGEDVPSEAPQNFTEFQHIDAKTKRFRWSPVPVESLNGHFIGYKIQVRTPNLIHPDEVRELRVPNTTTEADVSILVPDTINEVHVLAFNGAYNGPPSNIRSFKTPEGVPGRVVEIDAFPMGSNLLHVKWEKPLEPNGRLIGYRVFYKKVINLGVGDEHKVEDISNPEETEVSIAGLDSGTTYRIYVAARTRVGAGMTNYIEVTTRSNVTGPPGIPKFKFSSLPEDRGKTVLKITVVPSFLGNPGSSFKIQYRRKGEKNWGDINLEPDKYWTVLKGLDPEIKYEVRVVAMEKEFSTPSSSKMIQVGYSEGSVYRISSVKEDDGIQSRTWLIAMLCVIGLLFLLLFLVCLLKRNRGGKYSVHKKEAAQGRDFDYPDDGGFNEYSKPVDGMKGSRGSLNSSVKNPESETDSMAEYGDGETGQFTEDGSFIGQYGSKNRKEKSDQNATSPSALATFV